MIRLRLLFMLAPFQVSGAYTVNVSDDYIPPTDIVTTYRSVGFSGVSGNHTPAFSTSFENIYNDSFTYDPNDPTLTLPAQNYDAGANIYHANSLAVHGVTELQITFDISDIADTIRDDVANNVLIHAWGRNSNQDRDNGFNISLLRSGATIDSLTGVSIADTTEAFSAFEIASSDALGFDQVYITSTINSFSLAEIRVAVSEDEEVPLTIDEDTNYTTFLTQADAAQALIDTFVETATTNEDLSSTDEIEAALSGVTGVDVAATEGETVVVRTFSDESTTSLANPENTYDESISDSVVQGSELLANSSDLTLNGAYHRTLHNRLRNEQRIEWATYDYESSDTSNLLTEYFELGMASRLQTDSLAFGASVGYLNNKNSYQTTSGDNDFAATSFSFTGEVDKSFFQERLVLSVLGNYSKHTSTYSRTSILDTNIETSYTDFTTQEYDLVLTNSSDSTITAVFDPFTLSETSGTGFVVSDGTSADTYEGSADGESNAIRLRGDYLLFDNKLLALKPRVAYTLKQTSIASFEETGGTYNNTYGEHNVSNSQVRLGVDVDWFLSKKFELRMMGDYVNSTTEAYSLNVANELTSTDGINYEIPEVSVTYNRYGLELAYYTEDSAQYYFLISKSQGDVESTGFSISFQNSF